MTVDAMEIATLTLDGFAGGQVLGIPDAHPERPALAVGR
jgi:hypothetical protein